MFVITGITGKVGGRVGDTLAEAGLPVRASVRCAEKGASWKARGCEIAFVPDAADVQSLARAFAGATGVFLMNPPNYDSERDFPDIERSAKATAEAICQGQTRQDRLSFNHRRPCPGVQSSKPLHPV